MPHMEGLELIQEVRIQHPHIPVILMTAFGSEEVAMRALRAGAANYIPKKYLARDLARPCVMSWPSRAWAASAERIRLRWSGASSTFVLENDPELIVPLLKLLQEEIDGMGVCDPTGQIAGQCRLQEALVNAIFHGNLEVSSELRQDDRDPIRSACRRSAGASSCIARANRGAGVLRPRRSPVRHHR